MMQSYGAGVGEPLAYPLRMICANFWLKASPAMQEKYSAYQVDRNLVQNELKRMQNGGCHGITFADVLTVVNRLVEIRPLVEKHDHVDPRIMGQLLRRSSYVYCMLGGMASRGDLEFYVRQLQAAHDVPGAISPTEMLNALDAGEPLYLLSFLYLLLEAALEQMHKKGVDPESSLWKKTPRGWELDNAAICSQYHLVQSLIAYVEPVSGTA